MATQSRVERAPRANTTRCARALQALVVVGMVSATALADDLALRAIRVDEALKHYEAYGFSGVVLMSSGGVVALAEGYGLANHADGERMTSDHVFDLASVTKQFTSAAILLLEGDGDLSTEDTISKYLPGVPADKQKITLQQLLDHTSGISKAGLHDDPPQDRAELLARILAMPLAGRPGQRFDYENENYILLALIVEHVAGSHYEEFIDRRLLDRVDLGSSVRFGEQPTSGPVVAQHVGLSGDVLAYPIVEGLQRLGAGGAKASALDLHRWLRALLGDQVSPEWALGGLRDWPDGAEPVYRDAWEYLRNDSGEPLMEIAGDLEGMQHTIQYYPKHDLVVIVLCNTRVNGFLWRRLVADTVSRIAMGDEAVLPAPLADTAGEFALAADYVLDDGELQIDCLTPTVVRVGAIGQAAIDVLTDLDPDRREWARRIRVSLPEPLDALKGGSTDGLKAFMSPSTGRRFDQDWIELSRDFGTVRGWRLLGAVPNGPNRLTTIVEFDFEAAGRILVKLFWLDSHTQINGWMLTDDMPVSTFFFAAADDEWVSFDPLIQGQTRILPGPEVDGVATIQLVRGELRITARGEE